MKAYGGLSPACWFTCVVSSVSQRDIVDWEETQRCAPLTITWALHLGHDMHPAPGVHKPWVMDIPETG